ncbi:hypothetical protein ANN_27998 [Periplaneta americana]|uniref:Transposable element P transposase-like RNase H domain-containing protein n=1 Tax=Periplaneta americana TaxID=6978 RepID=A0ABQ8RUG1_PERAM|nr:hypothetical protein ANN_27998 [Periplaneta americana]
MTEHSSPIGSVNENACGGEHESFSVPCSTPKRRDARRLLAGIIRNSKYKAVGRRWTRDEKVVSLSLYERSPKSYAFLRSLYPLPSKRSLQYVLNAIHFGTGINANVFKALKDTVQKMSDEDRVCSLLFDEMSIRENLHYNRKLDRIDGFEDHGSGVRTDLRANHALVFMVRGLREKWKQPVAYYLNRGSTSSEFLRKFLFEVLGACQDAGLKVVATVCDMGSNNTKTMRMLGFLKRNHSSFSTNKKLQYCTTLPTS